MNKKLTTAGAALSASSYISPAVKVTEILSEGVLCMSLNLLKQQEFGHEAWDNEDLGW